MAKIMGYRGGPITPLTNWDDPPSTGAVILSQLAVGFRTFRGIHQPTPPWKPANDAASFLSDVPVKYPSSPSLGASEGKEISCSS